MGVHWERILRKTMTDQSIPIATIDDIVAHFKSKTSLYFTLPTPVENFGEIYGDPNVMMVYAIIADGRALDGGTLYQDLAGGTAASTYVTITATAATLAAVDDAGDAFVAWFRKNFNDPANETDKAWDASRLEYRFACAAPKSATEITALVAEEYYSGHLDWYNFDIDANPGTDLMDRLMPATVDTSKIKRDLLTVLPRKVQFPGMPHPRWWQFEEGKVNLSALSTDTSDTAKLLFGEFALIFSNDWMVAPFDVPVGSICEVKSMIVHDVFGQRTVVEAAGNGDQSDWGRWSMYNMHRHNLNAGPNPADQRLFIPPSSMKVFESEPVESVNFLRDEMANMVWGIEGKVPDGLGAGMDGYEASLRLFNYLKSIAPTSGTGPTLVPNDADIKYILGTTVPENWIPFIPSRIGGTMSRQIQLRRAAMPRIIEYVTPERIRPRTDLLKEGYDGSAWAPYNIHEEEVPRSGAIVKRTWQRTRWNNGAAVTWLGRRKTNGRGQANSGLEYDTVVPK
jgi:hypothetical protein